MNTIMMLVNNSDASGDIIDQAQNTEQIIRQEALKNHEDKFAQQREHALERMILGLSEICEDCGKIIQEERRERYPEVTRCVQCQQVFEQRSHGSRRYHRVIRRTTKTPNYHTPPASPPTTHQRVFSHPPQTESIHISIFSRLEVDVQTG
jgi:phage/conjugal plasmid C-4 type zinc finger TraR family protein